LPNKKLTILFPTGSFYPAQTGGPDNTVYWITKAITRRGHLPVISSTDVGQPETTPLNRWITTDYGEAIYTFNRVHYLPLRVIGKALGRLKEVDIIHLSMITYPAAFLMAILNSWFYGKPMVWSSRGDLDPPMLLRSRKKKAFVLWLINTFVKKSLVWFHSTCDAETSYIKDNFGIGAKVIQIPNYMELPERVVVPKEKYLFFIGRIDPKKAIENLIEALAQSEVFKQSEFALKIAGDYDNPYGRKLQDQVMAVGLDDKVAFLGHRAGREKQELLAAAHCLVMPSHTENFGIVVTEALAQGTPAIASTGTPWASLEENNAGYWVDNDPASLLPAIERVLTLPQSELEIMNQNALRLATEGFSIHARVGEWEAAYQQLL